MNQTKQQVNLRHARSEEQLNVMREIADSGLCPFCPENLALEHDRPIHRDDGVWVVTDNRWPYDGTERHLLFIPKRHFESFTDMTPEESASLIENMRWACNEFGIDSATVVMRFGESDVTGASVTHLHAHLIKSLPPDHPNFKEVRVRISGKNPPKQ